MEGKGRKGGRSKGKGKYNVDIDEARYLERDREVDIDIDAILKQAHDEGKVILRRDTVSGEQSRELTVKAEFQGLVVYKNIGEDNRAYLVVTHSFEEPCDPHQLTPAQLHAFSDFCNIHFDDPSTLIDDLALFDIPLETLTSFVDEVRRYGVSGLKRRNIILEQEIVNEIKKQPEYKSFQQKNVERIAQLCPGMSILNRVYNPSNSNKYFFSIDLRAAIFNCYKELGIIKTSWSEFVSRFTPSVPFANNKPARLHIFGELDKKRNHIILWNNALWTLWQRILTHWPEAEERKVAIEGDEIILTTTSEQIVDDAHRLLHDCGLSSIPDKTNVQCYRILLLELETPPPPRKQQEEAGNETKPTKDSGGKVRKIKQTCFIRQNISLTTGQPSGKFDVKVIPRPFRKLAMLAAKAHLGL